MVFSSLPFLFLFLPAFLGVYYLSPVRFRNGVALAASLVFYAWGAPTLDIYLAVSCILDYGASRWLVRDDLRPSARRWIAGGAVAVNVCLLLYFKYANFFVHEVNRALGWAGITPLSWSEVALPIGISFFTFQRISYIVDVVRKETAPARSYTDYLLYVVLFPQLIAGPIVRYRDVAQAMVRRDHTLDQFFEGMWRFALGLGKKVLLANVLGEVADKVFGLGTSSTSCAHAWLGVVCYAFQIYFDFSGYSDMAMGLARMIGFSFPENFNLPYISRSITEFWHRWHISLSTFMRDTIYIPLGGNRGGPARTYFNLWVVFLISGFWHGASWNFLLWGAYHGLFLVADRVYWLGKVPKVPRAVAVGITFVVVLFGWVLFRSPDLGFAVRYSARMVGLGGFEPDRSVAWQALGSARVWFTLAVAAAVSFLPAWSGTERLRDRWRGRFSVRAGSGLRFACVMVLTLLSSAYLSSSAFNPFIYFRF